MSSASSDVLGPIRTLFEAGSAIGIPDGVLLERFLAGPREAAEIAFTALVERHGPMVLRVCRSVLNEPHDAEDAFQATFLVLARRAGSIRKRGSLASWLHGAAARTAGCARAAAARRRRHEQAAAERAEIEVVYEPANDRAGVLHEELERLPERLRAPILLCHLEGLSHEQAAEALSWPVGTVRSRLSRGRDQLRGRLVRRGVAPAIAGVWAADQAIAAAVVPSLVVATARAAAVRATSPWKTAGMVPPSVLVLVEGAQNAMLVTRIKLAAIACSGLVAGTFALARPSGQGPTREPQPRIPVVAAVARDDPRPSLPQETPLAASDELESDEEVRLRMDIERMADEAQEYRRLARAEFQHTFDSDPEKASKASDRYRSLCETIQTHCVTMASGRRQLAKVRKQRLEAAKAEAAREPVASPRVEPKSEVLTPPAPAPRIGSVEIYAILRGYEKVKIKSDELKSAATDRKAELMKLKVETQGEEVLLTKLVPGTVDFKTHENRVAELKAKLDAGREKLEHDFAVQEARILASFLEEIERAVAEVAKAKGLNYVLKVTPGPANASDPAQVQEATNRSILYADPANDLTGEVIRKLNREFEGKTKQAK